jgi:hypothetical protein
VRFAGITQSRERSAQEERNASNSRNADEYIRGDGIKILHIHWECLGILAAKLITRSLTGGQVVGAASGLTS